MMGVYQVQNTLLATLLGTSSQYGVHLNMVKAAEVQTKHQNERCDRSYFEISIVVSMSIPGPADLQGLFHQASQW